ncbi:MAG TPA: hypothetical protein VJ732_01350 [Bryobacteraceae bacterium]|nr:hypothetical protein [Bryobacteraceae bacterium]
MSDSYSGGAIREAWQAAAFQASLLALSTALNDSGNDPPEGESLQALVEDVRALLPVSKKAGGLSHET